MAPEGDQTFAAKLLASTAVTALSHERRVASAIATAGWEVSHGVYYEDGETKKRREIDVVATQRWNISRQSKVIKLVVECKSASEWSVVFVPSVGRGGKCTLPSWSIVEPEVSLDLMRRLIDFGVSEAAAAEARRSLLKVLSRVDADADVALHPPIINPLSSGFVETNAGHTKDPEAAVTWKAVHALGSAITSFRVSETAERAADLAETARLNLNEDDIYARHMVDAMVNLRRVREYYHPIVVTQSPLWLLSDDIERIPWCRYELTDKSHKRMGWYDIVSAGQFAEYVHAISSGYHDMLEEAGGRRET